MSVIPMDLWAEIEPVFRRAFPREGIVAVMPDLSWRELENTAQNPLQDFNISFDDKAQLITKPPLALIHSHPNGNQEPSDRDTISQQAYGWTWGISVVHGVIETGEIFSVGYPEFWGDAVPIPPLQGRKYLWGVRDCWNLCRDYYRLNGRYVSDVPRSRDRTLYPVGSAMNDPFKHFPKQVGFVPLSSPLERKPGDFLTMQFRENYHNHCAIYLGNGKLLHQPQNSNSDEWTVNSEDTVFTNTSAQFYRLKGSNANSQTTR